MLEPRGRGAAGQPAPDRPGWRGVRLLGRPAVSSGPEEIGLRAERRHQLLAYLAYHGTWIERSRLAELFWGDSPQDVAAQNLRQLVGRAKRLPWAEALEVDRQRLRWRVPTDVAELRAALDGGLLSAAAELDRGPLLDGVEGYESSEFATWLEFERDRLWSELRAGLLTLAGERAADGDHDGAAALLERVIARDPFDEEAVALRLELGRDHRRPRSALRAYRGFAKRLERELGMEPAAATRRLRDQLESALARAEAAAPPVSPEPGTSFVGRDAELRLIEQRLARDDGRLLTLVGPSGIGKTRLAREALRRLGQRFDNAAFVPLLHAHEAGEMARRLAQALGMRLSGTSDELGELIGSLRQGDTLAVLDNLEHLAAAAEVVARLLAAVPRLRLLVTSHERLGLAQEWLLKVEGLPLSSTEPAGAVELFVARARVMTPGFDPTPAEVAAIEKVCRLVDGTPLGIELAAAWTRLLPADEIAEQLAGTLDFLADDAPDREARHRSLRAVFDYTWSLLDAGERETLARLAVFRGGFTHPAATAVAGTNLARLAALVDRSLIRASGGRFDVHPLLRGYLLEELATREGEPAATQDRHLRYYVALAESPDARSGGAGTATWRERLASESDNIRAALEWAAAGGSGGNVELGLRLAAPLHNVWVTSGNLREGRALLDALLATAGGLAPSGALARSLNAAGALSMFLAEYETASRYLARAVAAAEQAGDLVALARAHATSGATAARRGRPDEAREHLVSGIALMRADPDPDTLVRLLINLSALLLDEGDGVGSAELLEEALVLVMPLGDDQLRSTVEHNLGLAELRRGDNARAAHHLSTALSAARAAGAQQAVADILNALTNLALETGDLAGAELASSESLEIRSRLGDWFGLAFSLEARAAISAEAGDAKRAARLLGAANALRERLGAPLPRSWRRPVESAVSACLKELGEPGYSAESALGGRLSREAATALAAATTAATPRPTE